MKARGCAGPSALALIVVVLAAPGAHAQTRRVAVVNVATDQNAGQTAASKLRLSLAADSDFRPLDPGELTRALEDPVPPERDEDAERIADADRLLAAAMDALVRGEPAAAADRLGEAEDKLMEARPTADVLARLAEVNFQLGLIFMGGNQPDEARRAFRIARRFGADRDMSSYPRNYQNEYESAGAERARNAPVTVRAPVDGAVVYVDGVRAGETPLKVELDEGIHYYWAEAAGRLPAGARRVAIAKQDDVVRLDLRSVPVDTQMIETRRELLARGGRAPDESYRALAEAVSLTERFVAVVIVIADGPRGGLVMAAYDASTDTLGGWVPYSAERVDAFVATLPARPGAGNGDKGRKAPKVSPWYKKWWVWAIVGSVAVGGLGLATTLEEPQPVGASCCLVDM